jgi:hypothetical protein
MTKRVWTGVIGVLLFLAVALLVEAAPAYADGAPSPGPSASAWVLAIGAVVVVIVAGLSVAALRRAAARRHGQHGFRKGAPP